MFIKACWLSHECDHRRHQSLLARRRRRQQARLSRRRPKRNTRRRKCTSNIRVRRRRLRAADLDACNVRTLICHVADIAKCRAMLDLAKDFACRVGTSLLNPRVTLHRYEFTHRSYANRFACSRTLARAGRVFILLLGPRPGTGSARMGLLDRVHHFVHFVDRSFMEDL